ncbi:MAG: hypothetical protein FJ206_04605 [Gemmatimonadetes bacterium]|nr:hypothetical protein [Gemmatimonadota bacterium]
MRLAPVVALVACLQLPLAAQTRFSPDAVEEIQSLSVRVDVAGDADGGRLGRLLDDVIRQALERADILFERPDPRAGDCCVLRLDVRLATGAGRSRFGVGYSARLELGFEDRLGSVPTWTVAWAGRLMTNVVERAELSDALRFTAGQLTGDFIDLYRERFPRR